MTYKRSLLGIFLGGCLGVTPVVLLGCGAVGPPLPPETIGIEVKIRQQRAQKDANQGMQETVPPIDEDEVVLPQRRPAGIN